VNATIKLLDKYASSCAIRQDKDLAARLRVTKQAVSGWRNGRAHPDADSVARMCEAIGESIAHWLPLIEAERARNPEARKVWLRLAQVAAVMTLVMGIFPAHAEAATRTAQVGAESAPVYIMRNIMAVLALGTALAP
jgi:transcriptional regulator with XRE-family HTH domain